MGLLTNLLGLQNANPAALYASVGACAAVAVAAALYFGGAAASREGPVPSLRQQAPDVPALMSDGRPFSSMSLMPALPAGAEEYKRTNVFNEETVPSGLRRAHTTKTGTWGRLTVLSGKLIYRIIGQDRGDGHKNEDRCFLITPGVFGIIEPQAPHQVELLGPVEFYVAFMRPPEGDAATTEQTAS